MLSDKILRLRVLGGLDSWLLWVLRASHGREEIEALSTGNQDSMRNIGQANVRRGRVPLPPHAEGQRIVEAIEEKLTTAEHGAQLLRDAASRCSRLRQSILKWAFEGRLVDQDPTDEPASALLERISSERGVAGRAKPLRYGAAERAKPRRP